MTAALTYEPIDTVPAPHHVQRTQRVRSSDRAECPGCGVLKAPGQIVTLGPAQGVWDDRYDCRVVHRAIYCAGCEHVVRWIERCTLTGKPTGEVLAGPGFLSNPRYLRDFLTAHPEAAEVEQA
jgi:hypothetical protein